MIKTLKINLLKSKNKILKSVHNLKHTGFHKMRMCLHNVSKKSWDYSQLSSIYDVLSKDFMRVDLVDLEMYERWLNG